MDLGGYIMVLATWVLPVMLAVTIHEAAHGYVANMLGDPTAKSQGRLSLNPLVHIDWFGTILLPILMFFMAGFIFGYAKPVPVDARNFRNPRVHMGIVAIAGPASNLIMAIIAILLFALADFLPGFLGSWFAQNLQNFLILNCLLVALNMLPLPPLDGSRILAGILPLRMAQKYMRIEPYGILILVGLIFIAPMAGRVLGIGINPAQTLIFEPAVALAQFLVSLFGFAV
jgi:Zn-dependent protease